MVSPAFRKVFLLLFLIVYADASANKQRYSGAGEAVIFINSAEIGQNALVREISHQLYYSQQLQQKIAVTFIDINASGERFLGPAVYMKDTTGLWAEKYRPADIPALYCLKGGTVVYLKMESAGDMRLCL